MSACADKPSWRYEAAKRGFALNDDQDKIAAHLQKIWDAGGGPFGTLFGTLGTLADEGSAGYRSALWSILTARQVSPGRAGGRLPSCPARRGRAGHRRRS